MTNKLITKEFVDDIVSHLSLSDLGKLNWIHTQNLIIMISENREIPDTMRKIVINKSTGRVSRGLCLILAMHASIKYDIECLVTYE